MKTRASFRNQNAHFAVGVVAALALAHGITACGGLVEPGTADEQTSGLTLSAKTTVPRLPGATVSPSSNQRLSAVKAYRLASGNFTYAKVGLLPDTKQVLGPYTQVDVQPALGPERRIIRNGRAMRVSLNGRYISSMLGSRDYTFRFELPSAGAKIGTAFPEIAAPLFSAAEVAAFEAAGTTGHKHVRDTAVVRGVIPVPSAPGEDAFILVAQGTIRRCNAPTSTAWQRAGALPELGPGCSSAISGISHIYWAVWRDSATPGQSHSAALLGEYAMVWGPLSADDLPLQGLGTAFYVDAASQALFDSRGVDVLSIAFVLDLARSGLNPTLKTRLAHAAAQLPKAMWQRFLTTRKPLSPALH